MAWCVCVARACVYVYKRGGESAWLAVLEQIHVAVSEGCVCVCVRGRVRACSPMHATYMLIRQTKAPVNVVFALFKICGTSRYPVLRVCVGRRARESACVRVRACVRECVRECVFCGVCEWFGWSMFHSS